MFKFLINSKNNQPKTLKRTLILTIWTNHVQIKPTDDIKISNKILKLIFTKYLKKWWVFDFFFAIDFKNWTAGPEAQVIN